MPNISNIKNKQRVKTDKKNFSKIISISSVVFLVLVTVLTVGFLKQQTNFEQHASGPTTPSQDLLAKIKASFFPGQQYHLGGEHVQNVTSPDKYLTTGEKDMIAKGELQGTSHNTMGAPTMLSGAIPSSVSLRGFAPSVGNQGGLNSCTTWAIVYGLRGWYANRDGYYPVGGNQAGFAPMYVYSLINKGADNGSSASDVVNTLLNYGSDPLPDYKNQSNTPLPSTQQLSYGRNYAIGGTQGVDWDIVGGGKSGRVAAEKMIASGKPVALAIHIYPSFYHINGNDYYTPGNGEQDQGIHEVAAYAYDDKGITIENSWGSGWGVGGWANLSNSYLDANLDHFTYITGIAPQITCHGANPSGQAGSCIPASYCSDACGSSCAKYSCGSSNVLCCIGKLKPTPTPIPGYSVCRQHSGHCVDPERGQQCGKSQTIADYSCGNDANSTLLCCVPGSSPTQPPPPPTPTPQPATSACEQRGGTCIPTKYGSCEDNGMTHDSKDSCLHSSVQLPAYCCK